MSAPSQNRPGSRKAYRVALIGYFREECTVLARNEEEAEELACNIGDWEIVYQEGDYTEVELVEIETGKAGA
ncbi:MAG: hypothetical protein L3J67_04220 [Hyphomicrobiaceae bacterium]|nr:hypothetical protein [Hyphomicrobiaceae bacterium]